MGHSVLFVSDFFYPNCGGVESHMYKLAHCLMKQGHKVVVVTHAYGKFRGVHYLEGTLKVYYLPRLPFYNQTTFPTIFGTFSVIRTICDAENVTIVHAHQAFSTLGLESLLHARTMGYKVVFTDHSLFGFADASSILMNKLLKCVLADVNAVICVSYVSKENTVLRACVPPNRVRVIPNAVDADDFTPDPSRYRPKRSTDPITIVALSRLVYRKGVDILALLLPALCERHPNVNVIIGGDGPKRQLLEATIEEWGLEGRVQLVGEVARGDVRDFLLQGHIFVNASLTEAFCIALVEAAAVGLLCVSTRVGGVPEVLPPDMLLLAEPTPAALLETLEDALTRVISVDPVTQHERVRNMYNWSTVASRTGYVYDAVANDTAYDNSIIARLNRHHQCGTWAGKLFCMLMVLEHFVWCLLEWFYPLPRSTRTSLPCRQVESKKDA